MAIYDSGTASLAANGTVTGVGTTWMAPLTLIRVGATIVFKTEPVQIYTISEIISDTQIKVYNPNSDTVPAGTGYAILAHDGITVQGLAQDVAETLRYYQSQESYVAQAVDAFNNFDANDFDNKVNQVNTQYGDIVSIGTQVATDAAQVSSDVSSSQINATNASSAADRAEAAANAVSGSLTLNFSDGGQLESPNQQVLYINGAEVRTYVWTGSLPKTFPAGSTPSSTGGVSIGSWIEIGELISGYQYSYLGLSTQQNTVSKNTDAILDVNTGMFWVYEGSLSTPVIFPAGTVPPANPMSSYKLNNWRCVGFLNGYDEHDVKNYGAKCDGVNDDYQPYQLALYHSKSYVTHIGDARIAGGVLIKPVGVSMIGSSGYVGAQLGNNLPASTMTFDGPTGNSNYAVWNGEQPGTEDSGRVEYIYFRAIGDSKDSLSCILLTKSGNASNNGILNFFNGIKFNGGAAYMQIHSNNINSCNCCIDAGGSESHITNNHGYSDSLRTSATFRPAVLIRGSGNIFSNNKFFGDGSNNPIGVEVWGFGNVITGNVLDAFTDIGILIRANDASVTPSNNVISSNAISAIGLASDVANTFRSGIVIDNTGAEGNINSTSITGNTFFNKRNDRQMKYGVVLNVVSGSPGGARTVYDTIITGNSFGPGIEDRKIIALGANHYNSRASSNGGVIMESFGSGSYTNGQLIAHGMSRPPEFIEFTAIDTGAIVSVFFTNIDATNFQINIRDSSGFSVSGARTVAWKASRLSL